MKANFANSGLRVEVNSENSTNPVTVRSGIGLNRIKASSLDGFINQRVESNTRRIEALEGDVEEIKQNMIIFDDLGE